MSNQFQLLLWNALRPIAESMGIRRPQPDKGNAEQKPAKVRVVEVQIAHPARRKAKPPARPVQPAVAKRTAPRTSKARQLGAMEQRYADVTQLMLKTYGVRVRKWRSSMSGIAWYVTYRDGSIVRLIESPKPKGPMSMAVFLHEIGHHAIGFDVYKPRCLEEFHAWEFAIRAMKEHNLNLSEQVMKRRHRSLEYAVGKACRRGIKAIPIELAEFIPARYRAAYQDVRQAS